MRRKSMCQNNNHPRGFTLIELMVALLLLSIVLTLLYSSFAQVSSGSKNINRMLGDRQELRLLTSIIIQDLESARYFAQFSASGLPSGIQSEYDYISDRKFTKIHFHSMVNSRFFRRVENDSDPGMHEISYWVERDSDDPSLMILMRREDYYLDDDMTSGGTSTELVKNIRTFKVEFLPPQKLASGQDVRWLESWDSAKNKGKELPMSIRVTLAIRNEMGTDVEESMEINLPTVIQSL